MISIATIKITLSKTDNSLARIIFSPLNQKTQDEGVIQTTQKQSIAHTFSFKRYT